MRHYQTTTTTTRIVPPILEIPITADLNKGSSSDWSESSKSSTSSSNGVQTIHGVTQLSSQSPPAKIMPSSKIISMHRQKHINSSSCSSIFSILPTGTSSRNRSTTSAVLCLGIATLLLFCSSFQTSHAFQPQQPDGDGEIELSASASSGSDASLKADASPVAKKLSEAADAAGKTLSEAGEAVKQGAADTKAALDDLGDKAAKKLSDLGIAAAQTDKEVDEEVVEVKKIAVEGDSAAAAEAEKLVEKGTGEQGDMEEEGEEQTEKDVKVPTEKEKILTKTGTDEGLTETEYEKVDEAVSPSSTTTVAPAPAPVESSSFEVDIGGDSDKEAEEKVIEIDPKTSDDSPVTSCFECNSIEDEKCADDEWDPDYAKQKFHVDCAKKKPVSVGGFIIPDNPVGCRKILFEIDGEDRTVRQCAWSGPKNVYGLRKSGSDGFLRWFYTCPTDDCNRSIQSAFPSIILILLLVILNRIL